MHRLSRIAILAMLPALLVAGCDDWLTGPKLTTDPNRPVDADRNQLFTVCKRSCSFNRPARWRA